MTESTKSHRGLRALLADLVGDEPRPRGPCDDTRQRLDLYASDEMDGVDVRQRHPALWKHLQTCADCRAEHDSLLELLAAERAGQLRSPPPGEPAAREREQPWRLLVEAAEGAHRPALVFVFAPAYLRQSLHPATGARAAGASAASSRLVEQPASHGADTLLLSYLGESRAGEVMVQLYARPLAGDPTQCELVVIAVGEPMPRTAALTWAGCNLETPLGSDGMGRFGLVPLDVLDSAGGERPSFVLRVPAPAD